MTMKFFSLDSNTLFGFLEEADRKKIFSDSNPSFFFQLPEPATLS